MSKKKNIMKSINPALYISICTLLSYILLVATAFLAAVVCNMTDDPSSLTSVLSFVSLLFTAALGSFVFSRLKGEGGALCAILTAAMFVVVRIVISLFLSGTDFSDLLDCICYLGTGVIFALLGGKRIKRRRK